MSERRVANPKVLLIVAGIALVLFSAIAIFMAVSYSPQTSTPTPLPSSSTTSVRPG
jgi:energy-converting hydrogenase Eha subunit F